MAFFDHCDSDGGDGACDEDNGSCYDDGGNGMLLSDIDHFDSCKRPM